MSEYQYVEFQAIDALVSDKNMAFMEEQSSRAEISKSSFINEYHFGDFGGDAEEMLRRGYDMHLHFANFGIRKLMIRLPELPCDKKTFRKFASVYGLDWAKDRRGAAGILTIEPEADAGTYDYLHDASSYLDRLLPLRAMLVMGDLRPLFYFWLGCTGYLDDTVPPVPAGLGKRHDAFDALVEFYEIPTDALKLASAKSAAAPATVDVNKAVEKWLGKKTKAELHSLTTAFVTTDPSATRAAVMADFRKSQKRPAWPLAPATVTAEQLRQAAGWEE